MSILGHRSILAFGGVLLAVVLFVLVEVLIIMWSGSPVPAPVIPRKQTYGTGRSLTYVVMGDSTSVSQGSAYEQGFAVASAKYLARNHAVTLINTGVSGARLADVARTQLPQAIQQHPDVVLLAAGANDATHFTASGSVERSLQEIISGLRRANPSVKIIVTGSPAMDSVSRFPFGAKQLMGVRTRQVNDVFRRVTDRNNVVWAPIAHETRSAFLADPTLFAPDKFHPNARGYALWTPIILRSIDTALQE